MLERIPAESQATGGKGRPGLRFFIKPKTVADVDAEIRMNRGHFPNNPKGVVHMKIVRVKPAYEITNCSPNCVIYRGRLAAIRHALPVIDMSFEGFDYVDTAVGRPPIHDD